MKLPITKQQQHNPANIIAALKILDRIEDDVKNAPSFGALDGASKLAASFQKGFSSVQKVSDRAGEVWIIAEVRLGEELAKLPKAKGGEQHHKRPTGTKLEPVPSLADLGLAKARAARARKIQSIQPDERKNYIAELKTEGKGVTPNAVLSKARRTAKVEKKHAIATAAFSYDGPFNCVVIDPPWKVEKIDRDVRPNQDAFDYPTMTNEQIAAFWETEMARRITDDCHLFMWTTQRYLPAALALIEYFKFRYVLTMVWHKPGGFQPIDLPQYNCEFAVYARRGSPLFTDTKNFNCCFQAPRREHSRKPAEFYETIRRVTGGSRVDVFSREEHEGFAQYGNELRKFSEVA